MRRGIRGLLLVSLGLAASCGGGPASPGTFVPDYADLYCERYLGCVDTAVLVFDGVATTDHCLADVGPPVADLSRGCQFDPEAADLCLLELETMDCPAEGSVFTDAVPTSCDDVWFECSAGSGADEVNEDAG